jgi:hypothetical protein
MHKLTPNLFRTLSSPNGVLPEFHAIRNSIPEDFELSALFALGIFNPFGPTVTTISKVSIPDQPNFLILLTSLNPFATEHLILGSRRDESLVDLVDLIQTALGKLCSSEQSFINALPTWFYPASSTEGSVCLIQALEAVVAADQKFAAALPTHIQDSEKFRGKPWDRATEDMDRVLQKIGGNRTSASSVRYEVNESDVSRWYDLVIQPEYIGPEIEATLTAWQHVTSKDGSPFSQGGIAAVDVWELLEFLSRLKLGFAQRIIANNHS